MGKDRYTPSPIDTKGIKLTPELEPLAEEMARNVHEVWAATRMAQGWTYGPQRDDAARKHPCLVPYDELSEDEKTFDRNTSQETIRLIMKLGFKIVKE